MSEPDKSDPHEKILPGSTHTSALPFEDIENDILKVVAARDPRKGFTYSPKSGLVFDVHNPDETLTMYSELINGNKYFKNGRIIYVIAVTCHKGTEIDDVIRGGYEVVSRSSNQPLVGYWLNSEGVAFLDVVAPKQFFNKDAARREGRKYGQRFILAIKPNGRYEHIPAD